MAGTVYALFAGIDEYRAPVPPLRGCVNDVTAVSEVVKAQVGERLDALVLRNDEVTRAGLTAAFTDHLGQAGPDDVALFCYSGHGSQQRVPEGEWTDEADRLDETLVLYDSRDPGGHDLADKELGALVAAVAARGPHVVVVLDCCHSGTGTRTIDDTARERRAPTDERPRDAESYRAVREAAAALGAARDPAAPAGPPPSGWWAPRALHVLLAACQQDETAKEVPVGGTTRGVLSHALETALRAGGTTTYRDLHRFVLAQARSRVAAQNPQLETTDALDLERPFLGGALPARRSSYVLAHEDPAGWVLDAGAVHGIADPVGDETTHLSVHADGADEAIADAAVTAVEPGRSLVRIEPPDALDVGRTYRAVVTALPLPPVPVSLTGDPAAVAALRRALTDDPDSERAALLRPVDEGPQLTVEATPAGYRVGRAGVQRALVADVDATGAAAEDAEKAALVLEHLARWTRLAGLQNPATALAGSVRIDAAPAGAPDGPGGGAIRVRYGPGPEQYPALDLTLTSTEPRRTLWCSVVDLSGAYGVYTDALPAAVELAPNQSVPVRLEFEIQDELWQAGVHELDEVIKVIVSTEPFDAHLLAMDDLDVAAPRSTTRGDLAEPRSTLERLAQRSANRRVRQRPGAGETRTDWTSIDVPLTVERPPEGVALTGGPEAVVAPGVTIAAHPALRAVARLETSAAATRDLATSGLPAVLRDDPDAAPPFSLTATRGDVEPLDALVLTGVEGADAVTPQAPLRLRLDQVLGEDEHLLPIAWDGEWYLPLGTARSDETGTDVVLERLAAPVAVESDRSFGGSVRILFRKLVGRRLGLGYDYPLLRLVGLDEHGEVSYDHDGVAAAVAAADAVLLYAHGIIGDTRGMARSALATALDPPPPLVGGRYQAVLAFDYENLDTPIAENARLLGERLAAVGLGPGDGKRLDVVAHSMGGLVARHFVELGGGAQVVDRLVTLGTPNRGSPWPGVEDWATVALTAGLNGVAAAAWPVSVLTGLLGLLEKVDVALDEMKPGSPELDALGAAPDPGVPYTVLVGNRSFAAPTPVPDSSPVRRLLGRLTLRGVAAKALAMVFASEPNDIAVSVASGRGVPGGRSPAPVVREVGSDHMSYFGTDEVLRAVDEALPPVGL